MTGNPRQPELAPAVRSKLAALRRRVRGYVWLHGLTAATAWLGVAFWASLGIDWLFEPPTAVRGVLLGTVAVTLGGLIFWLIVRRAFVRLSDRNMAMLMERRFPEFDESLLTAVELTGRAPAPGPYNRPMLAQTCRQAARPIGHLPLGKVFNPVPLRWSTMAAVLLAAGIWTFGAMVPEAFAVWTRRCLLFDDELWPRKTRLVVEGFEDGVAKVARGRDVEVIAKADRRMPLVPDVVRIRYRSEGGGRQQAIMSRLGARRPSAPRDSIGATSVPPTRAGSEGTPIAAEDRFQEYSHTFEAVLAPIRFDVIGGDDAVRDLRIEVVDNPTIVEMTLHCRFPDYMDRPPRTLPVTGVMRVPVGTRVTARATANKDLVRVEIDDGRTLEVSTPDPLPSFRSFAYTVPSLTEDKTLLLTLVDTDGIRSHEPVPLRLATAADQPPQLAVHLRGIGTAITPQARLPAVGQVEDDYGIARIWFEYAIDQKPPATYPVESLSGNSTEFELDRALEVRDLKLSPGQKLLLSLKAADRYDLAKLPNVGTSERWLLDVVTPEQLRTMLEARELVLRQRFERIIQEVIETRESLAGLDFGVPAPGNAEDAAGNNNKNNNEKEPTPKAAEPDDPPEEPEELSADRLAALRTLRVGRASQNSRKNAHETLGVAEAFADIRGELVNNRIDTPELSARLQEGIADPLRRIAEAMFPELEQRLDRLEATLAEEDAGPKNRDDAVAQVDDILLAMEDVLRRMLELEDFNKAVELLREIIDAQEKLGRHARERHKQKLRGLLED